ncbi:hypothetical protein E2C01_085054 [Portunus trituberculatus]|uniref:Uncharacterized protein n=1 Tax=Portunus trituberculatus TaxID=210409 RepID=A0A5B7J9F2_PORTR|nr:hypothetical protein [Portunus trituberculatus]
MIRHVGSGS